LIGFSIALAISLPVFFLLKAIAWTLLYLVFFFTACPAIFATIFTKDGMPAETWMKLYVEYKYLNPQKRTFRVSKRNGKVAAERNMMNEKRKVRKTKSVSGVAKTH
jgi:hypothetical protein